MHGSPPEGTACLITVSPVPGKLTATETLCSFYTRVRLEPVVGLQDTNYIHYFLVYTGRWKHYSAQGKCQQCKTLCQHRWQERPDLVRFPTAQNAINCDALYNDVQMHQVYIT